MTRLIPQCIVIFSAVSLLSGCVGSTTDALDLTSQGPLGEPSKTGAYPNINNVPTAATSQLTAQEKASVTSEINTDAAAARRQAAATSVGGYQRDVVALRREAQRRTGARSAATVKRDADQANQEAAAIQKELSGHVQRRKAEIKSAGAGS